MDVNLGVTLFNPRQCVCNPLQKVDKRVGDYAFMKQEIHLLIAMNLLFLLQLTIE